MRIYFALIGAVCLACAFWLLMRRVRVFLYGTATVGRVVAHEARETDESLSYLPVVTFRDANGIERRFTSVAGRSERLPAEGREVRIRYLPSDPKQAYIASFLHMWAAPFALAVLGTAGISVLWMQ
jgi:hypothetical protein